MPTPNWGPQAGVEMDQATFDAYVVSNPPGQANAQGLFGTSRPWGPRQVNPVGPTQDARAPAEAGAAYWTDFFNRGPSSVNMPQFQTVNQEQARNEQQRVIQELQRQAAGDLNSLAQQQLRAGYGQAQAQQSSLGSTMRGQSAGAAMRGVQAGQQGIQRGFAGDQQMLKLQEQQAAQTMLAQLLSQQQSQDIAQATGMAHGVNQGNALDESMRQFYAAQGLQGAIGLEQRNREGRLAQLGVNQTYANLAQQSADQLTQAGATLLGGLATAGGKPRSSQQTIDDAFNNG